MLFEQANKSINQYKSSWGSKGQKWHSEKLNDLSGVRNHITQSAGVRGSTLYRYVWQSTLSILLWPPNSAPLSGQLTNSERYTPNGRDHLSLISDLYRQN